MLYKEFIQRVIQRQMKFWWVYPISLIFFIITNISKLVYAPCPEGDGYCLADKQKCKPTPESYEGPFFLSNQPIRSDIREGRPGIPLKIEFLVKNTSCAPVTNVQVHVWQADALGIYSAYSGYYPLGDPNAKQITGPHAEPTEDATFLRGIQNTDENGKANFITIYPGWYIYRTLHLHFKITSAKGNVDKYRGEIYFPDALTDEVAKILPYKQQNGKRKKNREDFQFLHDAENILLMTPKGSVDNDEGLEGKMEIIIDDDSNE